MSTTPSRGVLHSETLPDHLHPPAAVHIDLDGARHIFQVHGWRYSAKDDPLFETGVRNALDFLGANELRATFFVIVEDLEDPRKRELIAEAARHGHEIASHSLTHRNLTALNSDEKRREIFESRERLAARLGVEVRGFRAPVFSLDRESLELVNAAGYAYDSSVFPSPEFARRIGVARLDTAPHAPLPECEMIELPMPAYQPLPVPFHPSYSLVLGSWYFRWGLKRFRALRAPFILLFHLTDFSDPLPADRLPNWKARLFTLSHLSAAGKLRRCEKMIHLVQRHFRVADTSSLLAEAHSGLRERARKMTSL